MVVLCVNFWLKLWKTQHKFIFLGNIACVVKLVILLIAYQFSICLLWIPIIQYFTFLDNINNLFIGITLLIALQNKRSEDGKFKLLEKIYGCTVIILPLFITIVLPLTDTIVANNTPDGSCNVYYNPYYIMYITLITPYIFICIFTTILILVVLTKISKFKGYKNLSHFILSIFFSIGILNIPFTILICTALLIQTFSTQNVLFIIALELYLVQPFIVNITYSTFHWGRNTKFKILMRSMSFRGLRARYPTIGSIEQNEEQLQQRGSTNTDEIETQKKVDFNLSLSDYC
jgi:hypothetical protein